MVSGSEAGNHKVQWGRRERRCTEPCWAERYRGKALALGSASMRTEGKPVRPRGPGWRRLSPSFPHPQGFSTSGASVGIWGKEGVQNLMQESQNRGGEGRERFLLDPGSLVI